MWKDTGIYKKDNEIVVSQFRETSGSLWDFRNRKIIYETKKFRISYNYPEKCLKNNDWKLIKEIKNE